MADKVGTPWLTLSQAAGYVQMAPQELRELVYGGFIPSHMRSEKRTFVHTDDLDAYMRSLPSGARVPAELRCVS